MWLGGSWVRVDMVVGLVAATLGREGGGKRAVLGMSIIRGDTHERRVGMCMGAGCGTSCFASLSADCCWQEDLPMSRLRTAPTVVAVDFDAFIQTSVLFRVCA